MMPQKYTSSNEIIQIFPFPLESTIFYHKQRLVSSGMSLSNKANKDLTSESNHPQLKTPAKYVVLAIFMPHLTILC